MLSEEGGHKFPEIFPVERFTTSDKDVHGIVSEFLRPHLDKTMLEICQCSEMISKGHPTAENLRRQ